MNREETIKLMAFIKANWNLQAVTEETTKVWTHIMWDADYSTAMLVVDELMSLSKPDDPPPNPGFIRTKVRDITDRKRRIASVEEDPPKSSAEWPWSLPRSVMRMRYGERAGDPDVIKEAKNRAETGAFSSPHRTRWYNPNHRLFIEGEPHPEDKAREIAAKGRPNTKAIDDALDAYYEKRGGTVAVNDPVPIFLIECRKIDVREGRDSVLTATRIEFMQDLERMWIKHRASGQRK